MWDRWKKGESLQQIIQLFDRHHSSEHRILAETGGIRPVQRSHSRWALNLAEREEISLAVIAVKPCREFVSVLPLIASVRLPPMLMARVYSS
jgi:hypothetical protein